MANSLQRQARHRGRRRPGPRHQRRHLVGHHRGRQPGPGSRRHPRRLQAPRRRRLAHVRPLTIAESPQSTPRRLACSAPAGPIRPRRRAHGQRARRVRTGSGINYLVTIGGDDTAFSGSQVSRRAGRRDQGRPRAQDDRQRPAPARRASRRSASRRPGTTACNSPATSTRTPRPPGGGTSSSAWAAPRGTWRSGIGKASAATVTIIAEEFRGRTGDPRQVCDIIIGSMIKRQAQGKGYGVAVLAEGLMEKIGEKRLVAVMAKNSRKFGTSNDDARPPAARRNRVRPHDPDYLGTAQGDRTQVRHDRQGPGLRTAVRRPDPVRRRVHPQPRLRGGEVPGV